MNIVKGDYLLSKDPNGLFGNAIYLVKEIGAESITLQVTNNCLPVGTLREVRLNDAPQSSWAIVTGLVMAANSVILPKREKCFVSTTASMYRHIVPKSNLHEVKGKDAINKLCFVGQYENGRLKLTNVARYIVDYADSYYAVYDGFCHDINNSEHLLKISQFSGMSLFEAEDVIEVANNMYTEDMQLAFKYSEAIQESIGKSTDAAAYDAAKRSEDPDLNNLRV